jgi:hypothetical protein
MVAEVAFTSYSKWGTSNFSILEAAMHVLTNVVLLFWLWPCLLPHFSYPCSFLFLYVFTYSFIHLFV